MSLRPTPVPPLLALDEDDGGVDMAAAAAIRKPVLGAGRQASREERSSRTRSVLGRRGLLDGCWWIGWWFVCVWRGRKYPSKTLGRGGYYF